MARILIRKALDFSDLETNIAGVRLVLSLLALLSLYIDPSTAGGLFHLDRYALITLLCHLAYSGTTYVALSRGVAVRQIIAISTVFDLIFATAIASLTEGQTSPSYVFFMFAITAVGIRASLRPTVLVTLCSVILYLLTVALSDGLHGFYIMRAVYLAIAGYLVGFFGFQKSKFETRVRELESAAERLSIARSLHDSYVQALAAVNLRLESCGELLRRGQSADAGKELKELQVGVAREYDEVRAYIRTLASVDPPATQTASDRHQRPANSGARRIYRECADRRTHPSDYGRGFTQRAASCDGADRENRGERRRRQGAGYDNG